MKSHGAIASIHRNARRFRASALIAAAGAVVLSALGPIASVSAQDRSSSMGRSVRDLAGQPKKQQDAAPSRTSSIGASVKDRAAPAPRQAAPAPTPAAPRPSEPAVIHRGASRPAPSPIQVAPPSSARQSSFGRSVRDLAGKPSPVPTVAPPAATRPSAPMVRDRGAGHAPAPVYQPPPPQAAPLRMPSNSSRHSSFGRPVRDLAPVPVTQPPPQVRPAPNAVPPRRPDGSRDGRGDVSRPPVQQHQYTSPERRGGFDRPLQGGGNRDQEWDRPHPVEPAHWQRDRHHRPSHHHHHHHHHRPRTSISISIGSHWGSPYYCPPAYVASPFVYYSSAYCAPSYRYHYYAPIYTPAYCPPVYYGPRSSFGLSISSGGGFRTHYSWLYEYRFGHVPAYPVSHCTSLVRPAVIHVVEPVYVSSPSIVTTSMVSSGWFGQSEFASSGSTGVVLPAPVRAEEYPRAQAPAPRLTTGADLGHTYLQLGDGQSALRVLLDHIGDHPNDTQAIRAIAVAYFLLGEPENGIRQIGRAYRMSPWLASRPLRGLLSPADHAYALDLATQIAARENTPDAWLTVAVLMQAEDRIGAARSALQRARTAGLDANTADSFLAVLPSEGN